MTAIRGIFFSKLGTFFQFVKKGKEDLPPSSSFSYASALKNNNIYNSKSFVL